MSKTPINFKTIDSKSLAYLNAFVTARISMAKEDQRHKNVIKTLKNKLEVIHKNRENDIAQEIPLNDVIQKHSTLEIDREMRKEDTLHKEILKPLKADLKDTYTFIPDGMYDSYVRKVELGKRGNFIVCVQEFLENIGIEEVSQSALGKLSEQISDRIGICVSNSKALLDEGVFSSILKETQFSKLFMSIFCDILAQNEIIEISV